MRLSHVLVLAGLLAGAATASRATTVPTCTAGSLATFVASGYSCEVDDKVYSNFSYTTVGADPDTAQVVVGIDDNPAIAQTGLQLSSAVQGLTWQTSGFSLSYTVTVDATACQTLPGSGPGDTCTITGAQGQFQGAFLSNAAAMTDYFTPGGALSLDGLSPADNTGNLNLAPQPITTVNVVIDGVSAGVTDPIDSFGLDIYQTINTPGSSTGTVPEPSSIALLGTGLLTLMGLSLLRKGSA